MAANALTSYKVIKSNLFIIGVTFTFKELIFKRRQRGGQSVDRDDTKQEKLGRNI